MKRRKRSIMARKANNLIEDNSSKRVHRSFAGCQPKKPKLTHYHSQQSFKHFVNDYNKFQETRRFSNGIAVTDNTNEMEMNHKSSINSDKTHMLHQDPTFSSQIKTLENTLVHLENMKHSQSRLKLQQHSNQSLKHKQHLTLPSAKSQKYIKYNQTSRQYKDSDIMGHVLKIFQKSNCGKLFVKLDSGKKGYLDESDFISLIDVCGFDSMSKQQKLDVYKQLRQKCNQTISLSNLRSASNSLDDSIIYDPNACWHDHLDFEEQIRTQYLHAKPKINDPTMYELGKNPKVVAFNTIVKLINRFNQFQSPLSVLRKWDANKSGRMSYEETQSMLNNMGYHLDKTELNEFMNIFQQRETKYQKMKNDYNKSDLENYQRIINEKMEQEPNSISLPIFYQFMMGQVDLTKISPIEHCQKSTKSTVCDIPKSAIAMTPTQLELIATFQNIVCDRAANSSMKQTSAFRYLDYNKDGIISRAEFIKQMNKISTNTTNTNVLSEKQLNQLYDIMKDDDCNQVTFQTFTNIFNIPVNNQTICWKLLSPHKLKTNVHNKSNSLAKNTLFGNHSSTQNKLDFNVHADQVRQLQYVRNNVKQFAQLCRSSNILSVDPKSPLFQSDQKRFTQ